jgi:polysaccharide biosynthesis/export protein
MLPCIVLLLSSCVSSRKITYFQDIGSRNEMSVDTGKCIVVKPKDMISIVVSSKDAQLAALFNLPRIQQLVGSQDQESLVQNTQISGYTIDSEGNIDFPVLGKLHVAGLNREQIAETVKKHLTGSNLIKDPVVTVDFLNLNFSILGEVSKPGKYFITRDQFTVMDAISTAGDLTIYGKRDRVAVIRKTNGKQQMQYLDLRSVDIFNSPYYYLEPGDIVYVEPNNVRANESTVNGNSVKSVSIWISVASLLTTLGVLIFN